MIPPASRRARTPSTALVSLSLGLTSLAVSFSSGELPLVNVYVYIAKSLGEYATEPLAQREGAH